MKMIGMARLGRDVEVRYTANGVPVANLSLAFNYGPKDQDGKRATQWVEGSLWRERAELLAQYLNQGQQLYVEVRDVHVETYDKNDGTVGTKLVGDVTELEFGAAPQGGQQQGSQGQQRGGNQGGQQRQQGSGGYQGGGQGQQRPQGGRQRPQQGNQGGGYGNQQQSPGQRGRTQQNAQRQQPAQQPAATGEANAGASGWDDFDSDIPF